MTSPAKRARKIWAIGGYAACSWIVIAAIVAAALKWSGMI